MADGTVKIGVELDDSKAQSQAKKAGDAAGREYSEGLKGGVKESEDAAGSAGGAFERLGGIAAGAAKLAAAGFVALTGAVVGVGSAALQAYSSYEQNIGGIQTLFGNAGQSLEDYAAQTGQSVNQAKAKWEELGATQEKAERLAWNAAARTGQSANSYMQQVTSFSASLISSLGGDTAKAVDYADRAMVDMSDNANKMGTNIEDIQNAYQGFAKQNYTMLDNLKLGSNNIIHAIA